MGCTIIPIAPCEILTEIRFPALTGLSVLRGPDYLGPDALHEVRRSQIRAYHSSMEASTEACGVKLVAPARRTPEARARRKRSPASCSSRATVPIPVQVRSNATLPTPVTSGWRAGPLPCTFA